MAKINGTTSNDRLIGTARDDMLLGYQGSDTLLGGAGNDYLYASGYLVGYGESRRWISEQPTYNLLKGGAGDDILVGGFGSEELYGGPGNDDLYTGDLLYGGGGNDTLYWAEATRLDGGRGIDTLGASSQDLDLRDVPDDKLVDIEVIDISVSDGLAENKLTLTKQDILAISSTTDTLTVVGTEYHFKGDDIDIVVNIVGPYRDLGVSDGFHRYKVGTGTLLVDTDFTVT